MNNSKRFLVLTTSRTLRAICGSWTVNVLSRRKSRFSSTKFFPLHQTVHNKNLFLVHAFGYTLHCLFSIFYFEFFLLENLLISRTNAPITSHSNTYITSIILNLITILLYFILLTSVLTKN